MIRRSTRQHTQISHVSQPPNGSPRPSPYELGETAARTTGTLKGLPYGPGRAQDAYVQGFQDATLAMAWVLPTEVT